MPAKTNRGLGRGLDALLRPETGDRSATEIQNIPLERIFPNRFQPRRSFEESGLQELAASIRSNGILEPILLRPLPDGFELVAGERRWRAAKLAGLTEIPSIVRYYDDRQTAEIALIENLQREDLNPIEEAGALQRLMQEFSLTQEEIARRIGRSRPYVANSLRLLQLPPRIQDYLLQGALEMGHARAMLPLATEMQLSLAAESIARKLTVRQIEARVRQLTESKETMKPPVVESPQPSSEMVTLWESRLKSLLQTSVSIHSPQSASKPGRIEIRYFDDEDLERLLALILGEGSLDGRYDG